MKTIALVHVHLTQHLIAIFSKANLEKTEVLNMQVEIESVCSETHILTQRLIDRGYQILDVEKHSILLNLFDLLEESGVQSTFLDIECDPADFLRDVKLELVLIHNVDGKGQVLYICPHDTDD